MQLRAYIPCLIVNDRYMDVLCRGKYPKDARMHDNFVVFDWSDMSVSSLPLWEISFLSLQCSRPTKVWLMTSVCTILVSNCSEGPGRQEKSLCNGESSNDVGYVAYRHLTLVTIIIRK